jgi:hypothetical protein
VLENSSARSVFVLLPLLVLTVNTGIAQTTYLVLTHQNAGEKGHTPSRTTHPCSRQEWRDTDWFKTRVPDQTQERPYFIQSVN